MKFLLTVIDIFFSKFVWIIPLKRKTGQEVANEFSRHLNERRPSKTWVDKDREFYNEDVQKLVELYSTENEEKSCVIEKFNRTIKEKCLKCSYDGSIFLISNLNMHSVICMQILKKKLSIY